MVVKKQKTIMESFFIDELSGVDHPAQEGAQALLIKRAPDMLKSAGLFLTSDEKGHAHLVDSTDEGGTTTHNTSSGAEFGHSHPWIKKNDGSVQIGMAEGHGHDVLEKRFEPEDDGYSKQQFSEEQLTLFAKEGKALPDGSFPIKNIADLRNAIEALSRAKVKGPVAKHIERRAGALGAEGLLALKSVNGDKLQKEQKTMTEKNEKTVETVEKELQEVQGALAISEAFGKMNDADKVHYAGLSSDEQTAFLKMDADGRKSEVDKAAGENPVVYTDLVGNEYRKSDDPRTVSNAKRADKNEKIAKNETEKRENSDLEKRAGVELGNLPGELKTKAAVLKATDGIEGAKELLAAANAGLAEAFKKIGATGEGSTDLGAEYEKAAEEYAKENDVSIEVARGDLLTKTAKGREIAKRLDDAQRQRK